MRKFKFLSVLLLAAFAFSVGYASPPITETKQATFQVDKFKSVQAVYTSQLGVRELTGRNDGIMVETYLRSVGLSKGNPWCAAFVKWTFVQAGYSPPITAWSPTALNSNNLIWNGKYILKQPQAGDVFVLWFPKLKRIAHTGFYDYGINSTVYSSVEGNTNEAGSREGDGVYRKKRSYRATYRISRWT